MAKLFKLTLYVCDLNGNLDLNQIKDLIDNRALNGIATNCITHYDDEETGREIEFRDDIDLNHDTATTEQWDKYFNDLNAKTCKYVKVKIPDGNYCEDCKFLENYDFALVDIMGNETGNRRSGYKCRLNNNELQCESFGCIQKVKKSFSCNATDQQKNSMIALYALYILTNGKLDADCKNE